MTRATTSSAAPRLSYLGAAGWLIEHDGFKLLIDPYFTRLPMRRVVFGRAVPDADLIRECAPAADAILITHPHFDHLMDTPIVALATGAPVFASAQGCELLQILGVPESQIQLVRPNEQLAVGPFQVGVHATPHRRILGGVPYRGPLRPDLAPPLRAADYRMDFQFSFLIEASLVRLLVASGIEREPETQVDVLLFGADATHDQIDRMVRAVRPRIVFPNHWDDMFRPLSQPARPMIVPPPGPLPTLRRINLQQFKHTIKALDPAINVILPELFKPYPLA